MTFSERNLCAWVNSVHPSPTATLHLRQKLFRKRLLSQTLQEYYFTADPKNKPTPKIHITILNTFSETKTLLNSTDFALVNYFHTL